MNATNIKEAQASWFRTHCNLPGVFADVNEVNAAVESFPGEHTVRHTQLAFAKQGAFSRRVGMCIESKEAQIPDEPVYAGEPGTPAELYAWLVGYESQPTLH